MSDYKKLFKKMKYLMPVWLNILLQAIKREKKEREKKQSSKFYHCTLMWCPCGQAGPDVVKIKPNDSVDHIQNSCQLSDYLLSLIFFLLFEEVSEIDELLHGLHLSAQVLQIHATGPAVGLQKQTKPLAHCLVVHL